MQDKKYSNNRKHQVIEFDLSEFLVLKETTVSNEELMKLTDKVLSFFSNITNESVQVDILGQLSAMKTEQTNPSRVKWLDSKINIFLCRKCKRNPSCKNEYPHFLCRKCLDEVNESKRCYICQQNYSNDLKIGCKHLCIFCASVQLRKNNQQCPICKFDFKNLLLKEESCDFHKSGPKYFIKDLILQLKCKHKFCGKCLLECVKRKECILDSKPISERNIKYIIGFISDTCFKCKTRKYWNKLFDKSCCYLPICIKCQNDSSQCLVCNSSLSLNQ